MAAAPTISLERVAATEAISEREGRVKTQRILRRAGIGTLLGIAGLAAFTAANPAVGTSTMEVLSGATEAVGDAIRSASSGMAIPEVQAILTNQGVATGAAVGAGALGAYGLYWDKRRGEKEKETLTKVGEEAKVSETPGTAAKVREAKP